MLAADSKTMQRARVLALPLLALAAVALMVHDYAADPYDPGLTGTAAYGHNGHGSLWLGVGWTLAELAIVTLILRPRSYSRSWRRAGAGLVLALPWTAYSMLLTMHAGGVIALHFLWMLAITGILVVLALAGVIAAAIERTLDPS